VRRAVRRPPGRGRPGIRLAAVLAGAVLLLAGCGSLPSLRHLSNNAQLVQFGQTYTAQNSSAPWALITNGNVQQFVVTGHDNWPDDPLVDGELRKNRSEVIGPRVPFGKVVWLSWAMRVPSDSQLAGYHTIVGDIHAGQPQHAGEQVPIQAEMECNLMGTAGRFSVTTRYDPRPNDSHAIQRVRYYGPPVVRDVWHYIVMEVKLDPHGDGELFTWFDGKQIVSAPHIALGYAGTLPSAFKYGIYRPASPQTTIVDYANVEFSDSSLAARIAHPLPTPGWVFG
jgi:hypothetical protein